MSAKPLGATRCGSSPAARRCTASAVLAQVDADAREIAAALDGAAAVPVRVVLRGRRDDRGGDPRACASRRTRADECVGVILWMHTFSPAKMWIAGLAALRKPLLHLHTQFHRALPWSEIDMEYMNTHQSAHGDREFGFMQTRMGLRRKTVAGHWQDPVTLARDRRAGRAPPAAGARPRSCASRASATTCATSPSPRATRSRRSCGWASPSTATASATSSTRSTAAPPSRRRRRSSPTTSAATSSRPSCARAARGAARSLDAARIEAGLRAFLEDGGFGAFTDTFEDLHGVRPAAGDRRAAADGGRLRLRRRGRLEDRGAGADPQGDGDRPRGRDLVHGGLHLRLRARRAARARRAHARDLPLDRRRHALLRDPPALDRRPRGSRPARLRRGARARP